MERMKIFPAVSAQHFSVFVNFNAVRILMRGFSLLHQIEMILLLVDPVITVIQNKRRSSGKKDVKESL